MLTGEDRGQWARGPRSTGCWKGKGCSPETLLPTQPLWASFVLSLTTGLAKSPRREQTLVGKEGLRALRG